MKTWFKASTLTALFAFSLIAIAQKTAVRLSFDATAPSLAPVPVPTQLGTNRAPNGDTLLVNSQYLMRNGKPWIPVMGEFHFTRYPEAYWEEEILKMKASGVQIIATYVIWIHHEEVEGQFDWSGQRNLRKFAQLCAKHDMLLYPRIGPWAHGEARNGGFPDWVLKNSPVRGNDPVYLAEVTRFDAQIGEQLHGLLWKDGGPVIGVQIENEYAHRGPGQGREHLATLKQIALQTGLDVPLYTVTGWDNAVVPEDEFLPVYGGYPDAPWDASTSVLPSAEVYAFRFDSRVNANMGAIGASTPTNASHEAEIRNKVPFLTAEVGGGIEDTYHRRPVLAPSDIPAMIPVMIGSGANLLGYYMYQGGENPDGKLTTLQESQRTAYPTDVPVKSYDFQAPLGEFGLMSPELRELKLDHYFLNDFGAELAPARVIAPTPYPAGPGDMSMVRASLRMNGESGFLFVNNTIREHSMPAWADAQMEVKLPHKTLLVPASPTTIPANSSFFWPVNLDLDRVTLRYATAQPILKMREGNDTYVFFAEIPGIPAEFAFSSESKAALHIESGSRVEKDGLVRVKSVKPGLNSAVSLHGKSGITHIVLLSRADARNLWRVKLDGRDQLLLTDAQVLSDGSKLTLRQAGKSSFYAVLFPTIARSHGSGAAEPTTDKPEGLFQHLAWNLPERKITLQQAQTRPFGKAPEPEFGAKLAWRNSAVVMAPEEASFAQAAAWNLTVPKDALQGLSDVYLTIRYQGDEARFLSSDHLLTDNFFNGTDWKIGLKRFLDGPAARSFQLLILPLSDKAPIFFEPGYAPTFGKDGQAGSLLSIEATPEYQVEVY